MSTALKSSHASHSPCFFSTHSSHDLPCMDECIRKIWMNIFRKYYIDDFSKLKMLVPSAPFLPCLPTVGSALPAHSHDTHSPVRLLSPTHNTLSTYPTLARFSPAPQQEALAQSCFPTNRQRHGQRHIRLRSPSSYRRNHAAGFRPAGLVSNIRMQTSDHSTPPTQASCLLSQSSARFPTAGSALLPIHDTQLTHTIQAQLSSTQKTSVWLTRLYCFVWVNSRCWNDCLVSHCVTVGFGPIN